MREGSTKVENRKGETTNDGAADRAMHTGEHFRKLFEAFKGLANRGEKFVTESGTLLFVPIERRGEIALNAPPIDGWQTH